jgi:all-trans-retinol 13,14-reductase
MTATSFDAVVVGSGIGGLAAAAALAKRGRRALVLERHSQLGGETQMFRRGEYAFGTGVHYLGSLGDRPGPEGQFGRMLRWLTDGRLEFASIGSPYDIVRLPGFEFPVEAPREAYLARLKSSFPAEAAAIDAYFARCAEAQRAVFALFQAKALPAPFGPSDRRSRCTRWSRRTTIRAATTRSADRRNSLRPLPGPYAPPAASCAPTPP